MYYHHDSARFSVKMNSFVRVHIRYLLCIIMIGLLAGPGVMRVLADDGNADSSGGTPSWVDEFGAIAIQDGGRTMPIETYADRIAVELTGRTHWSKSRGPAAFAGRDSVQLLCDLIFQPDQMVVKPLITVENKPLKTEIGVDPQRKFFSAMELFQNEKLSAKIMDIQKKFQEDPDFKPHHDDQLVIDIQNSIQTMSDFLAGMMLAIVPNSNSDTFIKVGNNPASGAPAEVQQAYVAFGQAYLAGAGIDSAVKNLKVSLAQAGTIDPDVAQRVRLEVLYNHHHPWIWTAFLYGMSIVFFGLSHITLRKPMTILAVILLIAGIVEQCLGIGLRVIILDRPPVSNTYEAILWMGLIAIAVAGIAQILNRGGWYIIGGLVAAELCVLFSMLIPLEDTMTTIPPVLRSNYWLIIHVLTIVASYGVFALCAILGHVYLFRSVLFARKGESLKPMGNPIIAQCYRTMQVGVFLLTVGTILGGVWAADSWGRFWGWDPKETWALISIVVYVAFLHARFVGWFKDFGLAMSSIIGFVSIVWTFYGVNYVMASGLHSYGFGSGGEKWVGLWALAEGVFLVIAKIRHRQLLEATREARRASYSHHDDASTHSGSDAPHPGATPQAG